MNHFSMIRLASKWTQLFSSQTFRCYNYNRQLIKINMKTMINEEIIIQVPVTSRYTMNQ